MKSGVLTGSLTTWYSAAAAARTRAAPPSSNEDWGAAATCRTGALSGCPRNTGLGRFRRTGPDHTDGTAKLAQLDRVRTDRCSTSMAPARRRREVKHDAFGLALIKERGDKGDDGLDLVFPGARQHPSLDPGATSGTETVLRQREQ